MMADLHGELDTQRNNARIRRVLLVFAAMALVALCAIIASFIWRDATHMHNPNEQTSQIITIAITLVVGALIVFLWGMKLTPLLCYRKYLRELNSGLSRDVIGIITELDEGTTFRDGISFYRMIVNVGTTGDPEEDRVLYWDAQLGSPELAVGERVEAKAHGNDIIGLKKL